MPHWRADLHIHTVLSGCAEREMLPPLIVERALDRGLQLIAIADHNSAGNAAAVIEAAGDSLIVKPGLELQTKEGVHLLCLFDETEQALALQNIIYENLPPPPEGRDPFGPRLLVDAAGLLIAEEERPLFNAITLSLEQSVSTARQHGALVIAAHVERRADGILGVLGFLPPDLQLDGLEAGPRGLAPGRVAHSDAHHLADIAARYTVYDAPTPSVENLRQSIATGAFRTGVAV